MIFRSKAPASRRWLALSLTLVVVAALSPAALAATVPGAPTGLVATPGNGQVALTWVAPADDGGSAITDYRLQYKKSTAISWTTYPDGVSLNTFGTVPLLSNGTSYDFRVRARNAIGFGNPSNVVSATPTAANPGAPGIPANLAAVPGDGQVVLTWDAPADNGSPITDYGVQQRTIGGTWHTFPDGISTNTTATVTLLVNGTPYEFRVRARNAVGWGTWSPLITSTPTAPTVPTKPLNLEATALDGQVALTWDPPASDGGSAITDYRVQYKKSTSITWTTYPDGTSTNLFATVTPLVNGTSYDFRVRAINAVGLGAPSGSVTSIPDIPATPPGVPLNLAAAAGDQQATLTWDPPADDGGSAILDYAIQYRTGGGAWTLVNPAASGVIVGGLTNGDSYEFQVRARNAIGNGAWSASVFATPMTAPGIPLNLAAVAEDQQATLTWDPPADDGGSAILDYAYQYRLTAGPGAWSAVVSPAASGVIISGLTNGTSYDFRVRARNTVGSGEWSAPVSATPRTVPGAPTLVSATPASTQVALVWSAPASDGGAAITDYVVQYRTGGGGWLTFADGTSTNLFATVTGLINGTSYDFQVLAVNSAGMGAPSNIRSATPIITVPAAPVMTVEAHDGHVHLAWTQPYNGGATIDYYELCHRRITGPGSPTAWSCELEYGATNLTEYMGNLTNGRTYEFRIRAHNSVGYGPYSAVITATIPATFPDVPDNFRVVSDTPTTADLDWDADWDGGSPIIDYEVQYCRTNSDGGACTTGWTLFDGGESTTTYMVVTGLTADRWYAFQVRAVNAVGPSNWSNSDWTHTD